MLQPLTTGITHTHTHTHQAHVYCTYVCIHVHVHNYISTCCTTHFDIHVHTCIHVHVHIIVCESNQEMMNRTIIEWLISLLGIPTV